MQRTTRLFAVLGTALTAATLALAGGHGAGAERLPTAGSTSARTAAAQVESDAGAAALRTAAPAVPLGSVWDDLAECESSGDWAIDTGNGYHGGLQFHPDTWDAYGGDEFAEHAHAATRDEQIAVAERVLDEQGWGAWPSCTRQLGLR